MYNEKIFQCVVSAEKPALDPDTVKMWTLSATDMNDDDVVSQAFIRRVTPHTL